MKPPQANNLGQILPLTNVFTLVFKMKEISEWKKKKLKRNQWMNTFPLFLMKLFTNIFYNFICLFIYGCSGSSLVHGLFSSHAMQALGARASVVVVCGLNNCGSQALEPGLVAVAHGLSRSEACGIFPDQGSNPWQEDSWPLSHQGSSIDIFKGKQLKIIN